MRIGYDAKRLFHNRMGLGNYSRTLLKALGKHFPEDHYFLYTPSDPRDDLGADFRQMPYHIRTPEKTNPWYWRSRGIIADLKKDKIDIYHGLSHELPYGIQKTGITSIVTVHDTIAFKYPKYFNYFNRNMYRQKLKYAVHNADIIHCISRSTADDVLRFFQVQQHKIHIIPPILDEHFLLLEKPPKPQELLREYYLYVGALTLRKNLVNLFKAWHASGTETDLVIIGRGPLGHQLEKLAESYNVVSRIHILSDISYSALPAYYAHARALIYISEYEGFGLPLMEAAAAGCPVITSDLSSMPEVLGKASLQVNPADIKSILIGIQTLEKMSSEMIEEQKKQALKAIQKYRAGEICNQIRKSLYR